MKPLWLQEVEKQIRELEKEATKSFEIERVGWGYRVRVEEEDPGLWSEEKMTRWERSGNE